MTTPPSPTVTLNSAPGLQPNLSLGKNLQHKPGLDTVHLENQSNSNTQKEQEFISSFRSINLQRNTSENEYPEIKTDGFESPNITSHSKLRDNMDSASLVGNSTQEFKPQNTNDSKEKEQNQNQEISSITENNNHIHLPHDTEANLVTDSSENSEVTKSPKQDLEEIKKNVHPFFTPVSELQPPLPIDESKNKNIDLGIQKFSLSNEDDKENLILSNSKPPIMELRKTLSTHSTHGKSMTTTSVPTTPLSVTPSVAPLSATSQYSANTISAGASPVMSSYSLENCTFNELKTILSEKLIQLSQVQNQNAQLWTLVNKQRTMIFDLQRDFDNAVEQNEKLAKQLEVLKSGKHLFSSSHSASSPVPSTSSTSSTTSFATHSVNDGMQTSTVTTNTVTSSMVSPQPIISTISVPGDDNPESPLPGPILASSFKVARKASKKDMPIQPPSVSHLPTTDETLTHKDDNASSFNRSSSSRKPVISLTAASNKSLNTTSLEQQEHNESDNSINKPLASPHISSHHSNQSIGSSSYETNETKTIEINPYTGAPIQKSGPGSLSGVNLDSNSSITIRPVKRRPPPILVPPDLENGMVAKPVLSEDSASSPTVKNITTTAKLPHTVASAVVPDTNVSPAAYEAPLRTPSTASIASTSSVTKTPQSAVHSKSTSFDFTVNRSMDRSNDNISSISSPRHSDSFLSQNSPALYVRPDGLSSIWLDISTLIGKVKSAYKSRREDPVAIISALDRESRKELWKVIKDYPSLVTLDASIRPFIYLQPLPKLPDKSMFQSHAPSRVDARKTILEDYFSNILSQDLPINVAQTVCEFLSTDVIDPMDIPDTPSRCEGYLTKRGKKIRGWKVRYFIIEKDCLNYFDKPGGELQGTISLRDAKLGRQTKNDTDYTSEESMEKAFRHAFLLLEQRKKDYVRHVLCAESDEDRDHWIDALLEVIAEYTTSGVHSQIAATPTSESIPNNFNTSSITESQTEGLSSPKRKAGHLEDNSRFGNLQSSFLPGQGPSSPVTPNLTVSSPLIASTSGLGSGAPVLSGSNIIKTAQSNSKNGSDANSLHDLKPTGSAATSHSCSGNSLTGNFDHNDPEDSEAVAKEIKRGKKKSFFSFRNKSSTNNTTSGNLGNGDNLFNAFQATPYSSVEQQPMPGRVSDIHQNSFPSQYQQHPQTPLSPEKQSFIISLDEAVAAKQEISVIEDQQKTIELNKNAKFNGTDKITENDKSANGNVGFFTGEVTAKRVFGIPLAEAVQLSYKDVHHCRVPSIVYRCIELLKVRDAIFEEGIFRLNGSTATIRTLKERFNSEYDVDLVNSDTYYDVHAVGGLLKLYLREIPTLILSSYLAPEFRDAVEIPDITTKILKLKSLVQELPRENRDLLCVLCSLLTEVISHQDINKMNLRNVGIVFALTLNISSSVLTCFLTDFDSIFGDAAPDETKTRTIVEFPSQTEEL